MRRRPQDAGLERVAQPAGHVRARRVWEDTFTAAQADCGDRPPESNPARRRANGGLTACPVTSTSMRAMRSTRLTPKSIFLQACAPRIADGRGIR